MLPTRQAASILAEVSALIDDRVELEGGADVPGAVDRALAAVGPPERLAAALTGEAVSGDVAHRVAFGRLVPLVFAAHLVLAIVLTLTGAGTAFVPGIVGALPMESPLATGFGVLGIFFTDVGLVAVTLTLLGRDRVPALLHRLRLEMPGTRRDAGLALVLLGLVALLVNVPVVPRRVVRAGHRRAARPHPLARGPGARPRSSTWRSRSSRCATCCCSPRAANASRVSSSTPPLRSRRPPSPCS